jgi:hypothetical protein
MVPITRAELNSAHTSAELGFRGISAPSGGFSSGPDEWSLPTGNKSRFQSYDNTDGLKSEGETAMCVWARDGASRRKYSPMRSANKLAFRVDAVLTSV